MKERPILFSTPMVQAILDGRKTQTRRVVKGHALDLLQPDMFTPEYVAHPDNHHCPYGQPGDLLWVRETWQPYDGKETFYLFKADAKEWQGLTCWRNHNGVDIACSPTWKPSIHMPKAAARIWLQVKEVRVERLLDISEQDAVAEGWSKDTKYPPLVWFKLLWHAINGQESWEANPWVWVIKYKVLSTTGRAAAYAKLGKEEQP